MYPDFLERGNSITIISPSGKIDTAYISGAKKTLEDWGLNVNIGKFALAEYGRFAGTDKERLSDLQQALDNPNIKAILCSRGGYGIIHLLEHLSLKKFKQNPKWIIGYSDITALHAAIQRQGMQSIHAPMCRHLAESGNDKSALYLKNILFGKAPVYRVEKHSLNRTGEVSGILRGGNLSVLSGLRGTPYDIISQDTILFIEDIGEKSYHIERMIYNLKLGGILKNISGLIVGQFTEYEEDLLMKKSLYQSIFDLVKEYNYPVCFNFPIGHATTNYPVICGMDYTLKVTDNDVFLSY